CFLIPNFTVYAIGFKFNFFRELIGKTILCQDRMYLCFMFTGGTQNLRDFAFRIFISGAPSNHFYNHLISMVGTVEFILLYEYICTEILFVRNNKTKVLVCNVFQSTYEIGTLSLGHFHYGTFNLFTFILVRYDHHRVALHGILYILGVNEHIIIQFLYLYIGIAALVKIDCTCKCAFNF